MRPTPQQIRASFECLSAVDLPPIDSENPTLFFLIQADYLDDHGHPEVATWMRTVAKEELVASNNLYRGQMESEITLLDDDQLAVIKSISQRSTDPEKQQLAEMILALSKSVEDLCEAFEKFATIGTFKIKL